MSLVDVDEPYPALVQTTLYATQIIVDELDYFANDLTLPSFYYELH